jgi:cytochrome c553
MQPLIHLGALLTGVAALVSATAQTPPQRLGLCASCHGERGRATTGSVPNLAGQNLDYLRSALKQYQSGARDVPAMRAAASMLNTAELDQLLQWYAAQTPAVNPAQDSAAQ